MLKRAYFLSAIAATYLYFGGISNGTLTASPQNPPPEEKRSGQKPTDPSRPANPIDPSHQTVRPGQPALPEQENPARTPGTPQNPTSPSDTTQEQRNAGLDRNVTGNPAECCQKLDKVHAQLRQNIQAMQASLNNLKDTSDRAAMQRHIDALLMVANQMQDNSSMQGTGRNSTSPSGARNNKDQGKKKRGDQ